MSAARLLRLLACALPLAILAPGCAYERTEFWLTAPPEVVETVHTEEAPYFAPGQIVRVRLGDTPVDMQCRADADGRIAVPLAPMLIRAARRNVHADWLVVGSGARRLTVPFPESDQVALLTDQARKWPDVVADLERDAHAAPWPRIFAKVRAAVRD